MQKDLNFIANIYAEYELPKEHRFLLNYFKTDLQIAFLKYYLVSGNHKNFVDHTGYFCSDRLLFAFRRRLDELMNIHKQARSSLTVENMEILNTLESGQYKIKDLPTG